MGVYIEIGTEENSKTILVQTFERALKRHGGEDGHVRINWDRDTSTYIDLPFSYEDFKRLFSRAVSNNEAIDMRKENWPVLKSHLNGGLWFKG
ncbi:MAG: hypothetical protein H6867_07630 [Rhodospirillales bacterium]|nr:hypothetical protein [Rhodospirillales bacterium]MCB9995422.1 hypothetical protein [Rhodospirillales bacterium]